jgi:hypothetical protein
MGECLSVGGDVNVVVVTAGGVADVVDAAAVVCLAQPPPTSVVSRLIAVLPTTALFGLGDLGVDAVQAAAGAVGTVAVVGDVVPPAAGSLLLRGRPGLGEDVPVGNVLDLAVGVGVGLAPGENARRNTRCGGNGSELRCRGPRDGP